MAKIKISMTCEHKEYEVKIKVVQEQWLHLKMKFLLGYNMKIIIWWGYFSRWREWPIFQLVGGGIPLITPSPSSRENPAQRLNRFDASEKCCFSFFLVFPILSGHKLEHFPWGHQKQVGKFQNLQVYIEYGFLHNALKLDSNAHTKLI